MKTADNKKISNNMTIWRKTHEGKIKGKAILDHNMLPPRNNVVRVMFQVDNFETNKTDNCIGWWPLNECYSSN